MMSFVKMEKKKAENQAVIKHFVKRAKEIHSDFKNTLGDSATSYSTVVSGPASLNLLGKA